jgi:hypothetical protein
MVALGGLLFEVVPQARCSGAERAALARLPPGRSPLAPPVETSSTPFVVELLEEVVVPTRDPGGSWRVIDEAPAAVSWEGNRVMLRHRRLEASIDPFARRGWLRRDTSVGWPLEVTLRTALAARLPLEGGLPLHAAGLVMKNGHGVAFFGGSGAGKSTLAAASPHAVLSDEMVALVPLDPRGYALTGTSTWGTNGPGENPDGEFPLAGVCALAKGPGVSVDRLDPRTALLGLVAAALVPPGPPLWSAALGVIGRVAQEHPTLRLTWDAKASPWTVLEEILSDPPRPGSGTRRR